MNENHSVIFKNSKNFEIIKQFLIDFPRLNLSINNEFCNKNKMTDCDILNFIYNHLENNEQILNCIYFLTQTSLANFFIDEYTKSKDINEHLIDDDGYIINLDTINKKIEITKNFKKIYLSDEFIFHLDFAKLIIICDLENGITYHIWQYDFDDSFSPVMINKIKIFE